MFTFAWSIVFIGPIKGTTEFLSLTLEMIRKQMQISLMCRLNWNNKLNKKIKQLTELVDNGLLALSKPSTKQIPTESLTVS